MRIALSDHEDFYTESGHDTSIEDPPQRGAQGDIVIIGDANIVGLSLVDFGSILGTSLLSCAVGSPQDFRGIDVKGASGADLYLDAVTSEKCYFGRHARHVAEYSLALARRMRLPVDQKKAIYVAAFLHDIGKLEIAPSILYKEGPLSPEEYETMKMHPILAMKMISRLAFPWSVKPIILYHHERCDGSGYPEGLVQEETPIGARIVGVADFVDAYCSRRLYRMAHTMDELWERMVVYSGTIFDESICTAVMDMLEDGTLTVHGDSEFADETLSETNEIPQLFGGYSILDAQ